VDLLGQLAGAFAELFKKIAAVFDVFDLSFFLSGALLLAAVSFWDSSPPDWMAPKTVLGIIMLVVSAYVAGLVSFAVGRFARRWLVRLGQLMVKDDNTRKGPRAAGAHDILLRHVLQHHGFEPDQVVKGYSKLDDERRWRLYVRMWAKLRDASALRESYGLVRRYWVLAATYDGVATSAVAWAVVIIRRLPTTKTGQIDVLLAALICGLALVVIAACVTESQRLSTSQIEEVAATIATLPPAERLFCTPPPAEPPAAGGAPTP